MEAAALLKSSAQDSGTKQNPNVMTSSVEEGKKTCTPVMTSSDTDKIDPASKETGAKPKKQPSLKLN